MWPLLYLVLLPIAGGQTPVIGGGCALSAADVQIGGKQTQFFLKCESTSDSPQGEGVWVVKSRASAPPTQHVQAKQARKQSNICEEDGGAREGDTCAVSTTCLQACSEQPSSYLQCEQGSMRWIRKDCHEGTIFNFEQQACIVPKRVHSLSRQQSNGLVCTYSSCSPSNPCNIGSCNNGYCCSSGSSIPTISYCPNGGFSSGSCNFGGSCSPGYSCYQGSCCPSYSNSFSCPGGGLSVGNCVNNGCATGYTCTQNQCCPTQNPFVCTDGTQAVGGCVNGKCGTGYTCTNGLCCSTNSSTPRCLDGSSAVGACIPSCTGDMCGGMTVTYSCGAGYTCTTGNICCPSSTCPLGGTPIGPPVNGLCPSGYTLQGSQCCSSTGTCPAGQTNVGQPVNGQCPAGTTLTNGVCCQTTVTCAVSISSGPCNADNTCPTLGYACDTTQNLCCPVVNFNNPANIIGPAIGGLCPVGFTMVMTPTGGADGECVSLQSIPGICAESAQIGPCNAGVCQTGFSCFTLADVCCPNTRAMHRMPITSLSSHLSPSRMACPDGSAAVSPCINGLCGAGLACVNDVCCATNEAASVARSVCPDGQPAVSGCFADGQCGGGLVCISNVNLCCPPSSIPHTPAPANTFSRARPIGARCENSAQCVGFSDGLSSCDFGVCRCSPSAYSQGIACVRRMR